MSIGNTMSQKLAAYLAIERAIAMVSAGEPAHEIDEQLRTAADHVWYDLEPDERRELDDRSDEELP